MSDFPEKILFSEQEKQALTTRLQAAACAAKKPARPRRLVCAVAAALALTVAAGAIGAAGGAIGRLRLTISGQQIDADAVMVLHADGTATITVNPAGGEHVEITDPSGALTAVVLTGNEQAAMDAPAPIAQERDADAPPYTLREQDGRLLLHINGYIPIDVTDRLAEGVTFVYTDEQGIEQTATVSGTVDAYTVK